MATQWILGKVSDALAPTVAGATASAGSFAGGAMNYVGSSINGVGESINGSIRAYGNGAKDYGNSIMDWTAASSPRAQTASNPLGLSTSTAGGKAKATSPSIYRAPAAAKKETVRAKTLQTKVVSTPKPAISSVTIASKPRVKAEPAKKVSPLKASGTSTKGTTAPSAVGPLKIKSSSPSSKTAISVKPTTSSAGKPKAATKSGPAVNPLGLNF